MLFLGIEAGARHACAERNEGEKGSIAAAKAIRAIWIRLMGGNAANATTRRMPPMGMSDNANAAKKTSYLGACFDLVLILTPPFSGSETLCFDWAPAREPGFLDFQVFILWILEIFIFATYFCKICW